MKKRGPGEAVGRDSELGLLCSLRTGAVQSPLLTQRLVTLRRSLKKKKSKNVPTFGSDLQLSNREPGAAIAP